MSSSPSSWILILILMILFTVQIHAEVMAPLCNPNKYQDQSPYAVHLYLVLSELRYGYVSSSRLEPDVYGRVYCNSDLGDCLTRANGLLDELEEACDHDMGGQVADDVCRVRYEPYSF